MQLPKRKPTRLKGYDYSTSGAYFITICTSNKKCILSNIVGEGLCALPKNILTPIGKEIEKSIQYIGCNYDGVVIDKYVIMPNHIHLIVILDSSGGCGNPPPTKYNPTIKIIHNKKIWRCFLATVIPRPHNS